jgi:hypothetical protein
MSRLHEVSRLGPGCGYGYGCVSPGHAANRQCPLGQAPAPVPRPGAPVRGVNRLSAYASNPRFLCVAAALCVSEALTFGRPRRSPATWAAGAGERRQRACGTLLGRTLPASQGCAAALWVSLLSAGGGEACVWGETLWFAPPLDREAQEEVQDVKRSLLCREQLGGMGFGR